MRKYIPSMEERYSVSMEYTTKAVSVKAVAIDLPDPKFVVSEIQRSYTNEQRANRCPTVVVIGALWAESLAQADYAFWNYIGCRDIEDLFRRIGVNPTVVVDPTVSTGARWMYSTRSGYMESYLKNRQEPYDKDTIIEAVMNAYEDPNAALEVVDWLRSINRFSDADKLEAGLPALKILAELSKP